MANARAAAHGVSAGGRRPSSRKVVGTLTTSRVFKLALQLEQSGRRVHVPAAAAATATN